MTPALAHPRTDRVTNTAPIYLDNQSSTRLDPRVFEAMLPYFTEDFGNPHSTTHAYGRTGAEAIERARGEVARSADEGGRSAPHLLSPGCSTRWHPR